MPLYKRFEVWLLVLVALGGGIFILANSGDGDDPDRSEGKGETSSASFSIDEIQLTREADHYAIAIAFTCDNVGGSEIDTARDARLLADNDRRVESFFMAFYQPPVVPAGRKTSHVLRYWLKPSDLGGPLTLEVRGERQAVKSATPLATTLDDQQTVTFKAPDWTTTL